VLADGYSSKAVLLGVEMEDSEDEKAHDSTLSKTKFDKNPENPTSTFRTICVYFKRD
jgi:hypothetical protein